MRERGETGIVDEHDLLINNRVAKNIYADVDTAVFAVLIQLSYISNCTQTRGKDQSCLKCLSVTLLLCNGYKGERRTIYKLSYLHENSDNLPVMVFGICRTRLKFVKPANLDPICVL